MMIETNGVMKTEVQNFDKQSSKIGMVFSMAVITNSQYLYLEVFVSMLESHGILAQNKWVIGHFSVQIHLHQVKFPNKVDVHHGSDRKCCVKR